jgi:sarcosine oxidase
VAVETADVIVIGLGAVGSATLHRLSLRGVRAVGIDRFHPPHDRGSTHGESRITRLAVGEGPAYAPLVRRSHEIWRELEAATGETLLLQNGGLIIGPRDGTERHHGKENFIHRTIAVAVQYGVPHALLDAADIRTRYPQFLLRGDEMGFYEPSAGVVFPERCVAVQLRLAEALGAKLHLGETVTALRDLAGGVEVVTDRRVLHAARAVLTAGPWLPGLAGGRIGELAKVFRQTLHWFATDDPAAYEPDRFPVFIWMHGVGEEDYFYGFPMLPGTAMIKIASERYAAAVCPDTIERSVTATESAEIFARHIAGRLRGVTARCERGAACMYTVTPDAGFIVDTLPGRRGVLVASACSGHGFKHSAALGEILAAGAAMPELAGPGPFDLARYQD